MQDGQISVLHGFYLLSILVIFITCFQMKPITECLMTICKSYQIQLELKYSQEENVTGLLNGLTVMFVER